MIHTKPDFFNNVANEIRQTYFPTVKFYRDDKNCEKATYAIELFNNGCLTYRKFINMLAKHCNETRAKINEIVEKHVISFGYYRYSTKK